MSQSLLKLDKGPAIDFQIRDRKGKVVSRFAVPEDRIAELLRAVAAAGGHTFANIDFYGDTTFSHDACKRALPELQVALATLTDPDARTCASAIADAVTRVAADPKLNLFVFGN